MTIQTTKAFESSSVTTKTEVDYHHECTIMLTRIIDSRIHHYLLSNDDDSPISFKQVQAICHLENNIFLMICKTQLPD